MYKNASLGGLRSSEEISVRATHTKIVQARREQLGVKFAKRINANTRTLRQIVRAQDYLVHIPSFCTP